MNKNIDFHTNWSSETASVSELEEAIRQMYEWLNLNSDNLEEILRTTKRIELYKQLIKQKKGP